MRYRRQMESGPDLVIPRKFLSRASTATYIDSSGVLQTAPANTARYQGGQLLVEGEGTNRCWPSRIPTTTTSTIYGRVNINGATQITSGVVGIDGTANAFTVSGANSWTNTSGENNIRISYSLPSGGVLTFSAWVRTSGATPAQVGIRFNLLDGGSGKTQFTTAQWVRISRTATVSASGAIILASTGGTPWEMDGLQVEYGPLSSYIPTTTAIVTRAEDKFEESRSIPQTEGDYIFGRAGHFLVDSPEVVAQAVRTRLKLFAGEWFLDDREGLDLGLILGNHTQVTRDFEVKSRIAGTPGVKSILDYSSTVTANRKFQVTATIETMYGTASITEVIE